MLSTRLRFALVVSVAIAITGLMTPVRALTAVHRRTTRPSCSPPRASTRTADEASLRQAPRRLLLEPAALRRRPDHRAAGRGAADQGGRPASAIAKAAPAGRRPRRHVGRTGPEPDRPDRPDHQHLPGGVRPDRRAGHPQQRHDHPRRRPGRHLDLRRAAPAPGPRAPRTADTQSVGALAIAPSNDSIVYMGSGEGALSGDSYYGDGSTARPTAA